MLFSYPFFRADMCSKKLCIVKNFTDIAIKLKLVETKVEIFEMLKSIKLPLVNLSSVKIHGYKLFFNIFTINTGLNMSKWC